ncbi:TfoX/Sxy family protein [Nocardia brevicatena]|uniref:TfoX/Sxy family protein n=1 Tax=Nocardia brevicatena TaxID=37327 RepID=UPI000303E5B0|nr:TfoX/Sxy family protein [Nocardia brevicatena]
MAYDEELAERIRELIGKGPGVTERRMFGGLAFLVEGNMALAVSGQGGLMVRVDPVEGGALVDDVRVSPMVMRGRELDGWLRVTAEAVADDGALREWSDRGAEYARSLPPKR